MMILPIGRYLGMLAEQHTVRFGGRRHQLSTEDMRVWALAHGPESLPVKGTDGLRGPPGVASRTGLAVATVDRTPVVAVRCHASLTPRVHVPRRPSGASHNDSARPRSLPAHAP